MSSFAKQSLLRAAHLYWRVSRGLTLGVRGVVFDGEDRVCLVRHTYVPGWHFPGGGVEAGETACVALARELREEAGIAIEASQPPDLFGIFHNRAVTQRDHVLVYVVRAFTQHRSAAPNREIAEVAFHPIQALPDGTAEAVRRRLEEIAGDRAPNAEW